MKYSELESKDYNNSNNHSTSETSDSFLVSENLYAWIANKIVNLVTIYFFPKDDSLVTTENQDNDDVGDVDGKDTGEPPHFVHPDNLPRFLPRPSGNMVRIKCTAAGKRQRSVAII